MKLPIRSVLVVIAVCATFSNLQAEDAAASKPAPAMPEKATAAAGVYQLKNKSAFTLPLDTRAPFWPIGWTKRKGSAPQIPTGPRPTIDERSFNVTSILLGNPSLAIINGRTYTEGEFIRMPKGSTLRIRVHRITDGSVTVQFEEQMIVLGLRRPELQDKKGETEVLNADK